MANIAITNFCNLQCPYCFAEEMKAEQIQHITLPQLEIILNWLKPTASMQRIGIIGGEPTLHPNFNNIYKMINDFCTANDTTSLLFTNGTTELQMENFPESANILFNVNDLDILKENDYKILIQNIEKAQELNLINMQCNIGCNIYPLKRDYKYIIDFANRFSFDTIRVSIVSPSGMCSTWLQDKDRYYSEMKPIFLNFLYECNINHKKISLDCNQIPNCYFNDNELELIYQVAQRKKQQFCQPVIDITPDFKATSCFGAYDLVDCSQFNDVEELRRYLLHEKVMNLTKINNDGRCLNCKNHELFKCQGGCLAFAKNK